MTEQEIKEAICDVGHKLWQLGFVAANDGSEKANAAQAAAIRQ